MEDQQYTPPRSIDDYLDSAYNCPSRANNGILYDIIQHWRYYIIFLALGTSIALVTSWIILLPISRPLLKIPKLLLQITIIEPIKAIFELPGEISRFNEDKEKRKAGSSKVAKAGLLMGAVALARSSKPSKVPQAVARNGDVKNIDCHHKGKNKWIVTYETLHPSSGWISGKNEINPSISGFSTIGGTIDITWQ